MKFFCISSPLSLSFLPRLIFCLFGKPKAQSLSHVHVSVADCWIRISVRATNNVIKTWSLHCGEPTCALRARLHEALASTLWWRSLIEKNGVTPKGLQPHYGANLFVSMKFNESCIAGIIAALTLLWCWHLGVNGPFPLSQKWTWVLLMENLRFKFGGHPHPKWKI